MILRIGFQVLEFVEARDLRFGSAEDALSWLKALGLPNSDQMMRFRELLGRQTLDTENRRLTDHDVLERVARLLYSRKILVISREPRNSGQPADKSASSAPAFPLSERSPRAATSSGAPPANDPSTFDPEVNQAAQADALVAAAADGKPFCPE